MRLIVFALFLLVSALCCNAQWTIEESHTTASLRGIDNTGGGVAWASGTNGTVLRTEDGGYLWQTCSMPPGAEKLDFRGIQAFDENTAIVMSSGPGDLSRIYKTIDACQSWKLLFTNPDKEGFWDAIQRPEGKQKIFILGDPVRGLFKIFSFDVKDATLLLSHSVAEPEAKKDQSIFAASNSSMTVGPRGGLCFVTGGAAAEMICTPIAQTAAKVPMTRSFLPLAAHESAGAFSLGDAHSSRRVVVGGDYKQPDSTASTASWSDDWGFTWHPASSPPHGYRSAVAYDPAQRVWITVGPNGTDISLDDGRNWRPLKPATEDEPSADRDWNAISLPFVVGPKGRIGRLNTNALPTK